MNTTNFKTGDYIFYRSADAGLLPCKVIRVSAHRLTISAGEGHQVRVKPENCQLQEEWRKENDQ